MRRMFFSRSFVLFVCIVLLKVTRTAGAKPDHKNLHAVHISADEKISNFHKFVTRPDIQAPRLNVTTYPDRGAVEPGYWFVAPYPELEVKRLDPWVGPYIYDQTGEVVWSGAALFDHWTAFDFKATTVNGKPVLTCIYPHSNAGIILDNRYQLQRRVQWTEDYPHMNMHEFHLVQDGRRALALTGSPHFPLSEEQALALGVDSECQVSADGMVELDMITEQPISKRVFDWNAMDHIGVNESTALFGEGSSEAKDHCSNRDLFHLNSVDQFDNGDYLLSARHTDTIYRVSHLDGSIIWRLGGVMSSFVHNGRSRFSGQHHARLLSHNDAHVVLSLFDNAEVSGSKQKPTNPHSRGLILSLNTQSMIADVVAEYFHPQKGWTGFTNARGSMQALPNGNAFVCWSVHLSMSEYSPDGRLLMEATAKQRELHTYRAYKLPWVGKPIDPPNVYAAAFVAGSNVTTLTYVSWNGATEVSRWNLYHTNKDGIDGVRINSTVRTGFETELTSDGYARYIVLEAVDQYGDVLGISNVFDTIPPAQHVGASLLDHDTTIEIDNSDLHNNSLSQKAWKVEDSSTVMTPLVLFLVGFVGAIVCCGVLFAIWQRSGFAWITVKKWKYEHLDEKNEYELDDGDVGSEILDPS